VPSHRADTPARSRRAAQRSTGRSSSQDRRPATPPPASRISQRNTHRASGRASLPSISAPQVGIAGVLGIATIAAPISGAMAGPGLKPSANQLPMAAMAPAPAFPALASNLVPGVSALRVVGTDLAAGAAVPAKLSAPRTLLVTRAARGKERPVLPGCDGTFARANFSNGQLPESILCTLWEPKHRLRADAAIAIAKLNIAYKQRFGRNLCITDSYRTLSEQYRVKAIKPGLAATPGTSNHGLGLALDLCGGADKFGAAQYLWMRDNGRAYGWDNPDWALPGGSGPTEPWHWEYFAGE
jgi:zinc D-Ala-D-Ala carboxypeptidase